MATSMTRLIAARMRLKVSGLPEARRSGWARSGPNATGHDRRIPGATPEHTFDAAARPRPYRDRLSKCSGTNTHG